MQADRTGSYSVAVVSVQYSGITPQTDDERDIAKTYAILQKHQKSEQQSLLSQSYQASSHTPSYQVYSTERSCCCSRDTRCRLGISCAIITAILGMVVFWGIIFPKMKGF